MPATLTPTKTVEATPTKEQIKILLSEKLAYGNYKFDFEISMGANDKIGQGVFDKYGIESLAINEKKTNGRELLAKTLISTFLETYNFQNNAKVSLGEFMANPSNLSLEMRTKAPKGV